MDKNTLTGFILIGLILIAFSLLNRPSQEQIAAREAQQRYNDSIRLVQAQLELEQQKQAQIQLQDALAISENAVDSEVNDRLKEQYGAFSVSAEGTEEFVTLENELLELKLTTKGGRLYSARLKEFRSYDSLPLMLFDKEEAKFGVVMNTFNNRVVNTEDLFFESIPVDKESYIMRLHTDEDSSLDFVYTLWPNDYVLRFEIVSNGLDKILAVGTSTLDINWMQKVRQQEEGRKFEERYSRAMYKYETDNVEDMSERSDDVRNIANRLKWIACKDQYFSTVLIADESFTATKIESKRFPGGAYMKQISTLTSVAFDPASPKPVGFHYYLGTNDYNRLKRYDKTTFQGQDLQLERLVPLGWSLFRYVNKWIIIPLFDWLNSVCGSIGLAIFFLTLIIRTGLFPLVYKSLMSSAKMRVMRPQIEEINKKYPKQEEAMKRQQKTMELYRQVGINPMSGCLPMLLQMPFLLALFMFFPNAIELRHESFLWAKDLSTYDAIVSWNAYIPLVTPYFGNHISLFCLLMTLATVINTKYMSDQNTSQQMPGMKMMMYMMPLMMMIFLNSYPAGLNYYYFLSSLISIALAIGFRMLVDDRKILAKLEENRKKPPKKKSGFMARLEEAQRQQQTLAKQRAQQNRRR